MVKKFIVSISVAVSIFLFSPTSCSAIYNPTLLPNNIFGIHIVDVNDFDGAAALVNQSANSSGDWGYVTLIIQQNDRNPDKWTTVFRTLQDKHLIPIVRLATQPGNGSWVIPDDNSIGDWTSFLDQLPWPIKNRYIILFNEPNHAGEWGGNVNPGEYAHIAKKFVQSLKQKNSDFFILPAAMDDYAQNYGDTVDATTYWSQMHDAEPDIFSLFDGWNSHSYPNKEYSGSPYDTGRHSIKGYDWEIAFLHTNYQMNDQLPVFITETGWAENRWLSRHAIAEYYEIAFKDIWVNDKRIVAVTPFLLNYQDPQFSRFSWRVLGAETYHPQYYTVQKIEKTRGEPLEKPSSKFGELIIQERMVALKIHG